MVNVPVLVPILAKLIVAMVVDEAVVNVAAPVEVTTVVLPAVQDGICALPSSPE